MARIGLVLVFAVVLGIGFSQAETAVAQRVAPTVVVGGLDSPRGMAWRPDGKLYVAEAGSGGSDQTEWVPPFRSATIGTSGRILRIDGDQATVVSSSIQLRPDEPDGCYSLTTRRRVVRLTWNDESSTRGAGRISSGSCRRTRSPVASGCSTAPGRRR